MLGFLKKLFGVSDGTDARLYPECQFVVRVTDADVVCEHPDGQTERVRWDQLQAFIVETTDEGPWAADVLWILIDSVNSGCVIPQGATGEEPLLARLRQLPGFNNEEFIKAMTSTDNRKFLCWKRNEAI